MGDPDTSGCRWSTTGGRPRPAGRSPPTCAASSRCRSSRARPSVAGARLRRRGPRRPTAGRSPAGEEGAICLRLPLPPGTLPTLWGDDDRFVALVPLRLRRLLPLRRRRLRRRGRLPLRDGPHRRRHQRRRSPALDRARWRRCSRTHPAVAECAVDRRRRRPQGPGAARLRRAQGGRRDRPDEHRGDELVALVRDQIGAGRRRSARSRSSTACPRPGRARSCARRCARSPTAGTRPCPRPSRTRRCSIGSRRCCGGE